jgi:hypothetical protein
MRVIEVSLLLVTAVACAGQTPSSTDAVWRMQDSGTTAGLRGIDSVDGTVAWASGTGGTVLKTVDGGAHWQKCAIPDAATDGATLDFRGVQAWDADTAIVMASGPGEKSRLYKTADGCLTWMLLFENPDKDGFWDGISFSSGFSIEGKEPEGVLIGDPIGGVFPFFVGSDGGSAWRRWGRAGSATGGSCEERQPVANENEALFAASNRSALEFFGNYFLFATGGSSGSRLFYRQNSNPEGWGKCWSSFKAIKLPLAKNSSSSGAFAVSATNSKNYFPMKLMVVGGDYAKPDISSGTAVSLSSKNGANLWFLSDFVMTIPSKPPHGFRSAVQWGESIKAWITAGTNGSDISRDDGKTWAPLDDGNWNALSLPFIVGPNGRIARLNPAALPPAK